MQCFDGFPVGQSLTPDLLLRRRAGTEVRKANFSGWAGKPGLPPIFGGVLVFALFGPYFWPRGLCDLVRFPRFRCLEVRGIPCRELAA